MDRQVPGPRSDAVWMETVAGSWLWLHHTSHHLPRLPLSAASLSPSPFSALLSLKNFSYEGPRGLASPSQEGLMLGSRVEPLSLSPLYPGKTSENSVKLSSHEDSCSQSPELRPTAPRGQGTLGPGPGFRSSPGVPPDPLPEPGWRLIALSSASVGCMPGNVRRRRLPLRQVGML